MNQFRLAAKEWKQTGQAQFTCNLCTGQDREGRGLGGGGHFEGPHNIMK